VALQPAREEGGETEKGVAMSSFSAYVAVVLAIAVSVTSLRLAGLCAVTPFSFRLATAAGWIVGLKITPPPTPQGRVAESRVAR
jgi:hypothetical protein